MDLEHITHSGYRLSVIIALILSGLVVTVAAVLGRGALNLRGSLLLDEPSDVTVIALVEPKLAEDIAISEINFLRKEPAKAAERPEYSYHVRTSDGENYLVRLGFDEEKKRWALVKYEHLRASSSAPSREI